MVNLLSIVWDIDPILIHIGNGGIRWYGLLWALGLYAAYLIQVKLYKHEHCPEEWTDSLFMWITIGTIIGARVGHCWFYEWHQYGAPWHLFGWEFTYRNPYIENPFLLIKIWEGGLASHGGAIGIILSSWLLNKKVFSKRPEYHTSMLWILDRICIGACITGALIRLGNLMNSEIYGGPTDLPWGFVFVRDGMTVPCHPTQIYEMIYCLVAFAILMPMYYKLQAYRREGLLIGTFFEIIFGTRFVLEFIKNDQEAFEADQLLNMGQWLSLPFILIGIYLIIRAYKRPMAPDNAELKVKK